MTKRVYTKIEENETIPAIDYPGYNLTIFAILFNQNTFKAFTITQNEIGFCWKMH